MNSEVVLNALRVYVTLREIKFAKTRDLIAEVSKLTSESRGFPVTVEDLVGKKKPDHIVFPRHVLATLLIEGGLSSNQVGKILGDRDHGTILHSKSVIKTMLRQYDGQVQPFPNYKGSNGKSKIDEEFAQAYELLAGLGMGGNPKVDKLREHLRALEVLVKS